MNGAEDRFDVYKQSFNEGVSEYYSSVILLLQKKI